MVNTLKVAACVTAAGRGPSATFPPTSASTSRAAAVEHASWEPASATPATKGKTAKKVFPSRHLFNIYFKSLNTFKYELLFCTIIGFKTAHMLLKVDV